MASLFRRRKQPWGDEPWPEWLERQREKANVIAARLEAAEAENERLLTALQNIEGELRAVYRRPDGGTVVT